jgi:hypothetical protein
MVFSSLPSALGAIVLLSSVCITQFTSSEISNTYIIQQVALSNVMDGAVVHKRVVPSVLPGSWSYVGCYQYGYSIPTI